MVIEVRCLCLWRLLEGSSTVMRNAIVYMVRYSSSDRAPAKSLLAYEIKCTVVPFDTEVVPLPSPYMYADLQGSLALHCGQC